MRKLSFLLLFFCSIFTQVEAQHFPVLYNSNEAKVLGWATSLNGSNQYAAVANPKNVYSGEYSLLADFANDVVGQAPAGLIPGTGQYLVKNNDPSPFSNSGKYTECTVAGTAAFPCNQVAGKVRFDVYKGNDANNLVISLISQNAEAPSAWIGYDLLLNSSEAIYLRKRTPTGSNLFNTSNSYFSNTTWYQLEFENLSNGQKTLKIRGGSFGDDFVLVSTAGGTGTNPATDNTYTSSNYFVLDLDTGDRIANIQCEYASGAFDLNGWERILHSNNRDFEGTTTDWTGSGNHSVALSTVDKHSGLKALAVTTGVGNTDNSVSLQGKSLPLEVNKKYTYEFWARGTGVLGSNLTTNGDFTSNITGWAFAGNHSAIWNSGVAEVTSTGNYSAGANEFRSNYNISVVQGKQYKVSCRVKSISGATTFTYQVDNLIAASGTINTGDFVTLSFISASSITNLVAFRCGINGAGVFQIDNITVQEVTPPTLTLGIDGKTKQFTGISCVPGTWTKCVFNFQASGTNSDIKMWANQADVVYVDDAQFKQGYDFAISIWSKGNLNTSSTFGLFSKRSNAGGVGVAFYGAVYDGQAGFVVADDVFYTRSRINGSKLNSSYCLISLVFNRTDNAKPKIYYNGNTIADGEDGVSSASVGIVNTPLSFYIGSVNGYSGLLYNGSMGEFQFTRYENISLSNNQPTKYYLSGIPARYNNGLITLWLKWKGFSTAEFSTDYSPLKQNITLFNITRQVNQVRGDGKYISN